jgi:hypothetical protein
MHQNIGQQPARQSAGLKKNDRLPNSLQVRPSEQRWRVVRIACPIRLPGKRHPAIYHFLQFPCEHLHLRVVRLTLIPEMTRVLLATASRFCRGWGEPSIQFAISQDAVIVLTEHQQPS